MKKIITIVAVLFATATFSQSTSPRFGTLKNQDNTGRAVTYKYQSIKDAAGADSANVAPSAYQTIVRVALVDSFTLKNPTVTQCYSGDVVKVVVSGASGNKLKIVGANWISAGTATLSSGARAVISFIFDGSKFVELSRVVQ